MAGGLRREQVHEISQLRQGAERLPGHPGQSSGHAGTAEHPHTGAVMRMKIAASCLVAASATMLCAQQNPPAPTGYQDTPMQPNGKWHIHDGTRPQPRLVTPGPFVSLAPPSDAIVLLGSGQDLSRWQMTQGGGPVSWPIEGGVLSSGKGMIQT